MTHEPLVETQLADSVLGETHPGAHVQATGGAPAPAHDANAGQRLPAAFELPTSQYAPGAAVHATTCALPPAHAVPEGHSKQDAVVPTQLVEFAAAEVHPAKHVHGRRWLAPPPQEKPGPQGTHVPVVPEHTEPVVVSSRPIVAFAGLVKPAEHVHGMGAWLSPGQWNPGGQATPASEDPPSGQ